MSYTTLEVEIEHGRIVPKEPQMLPEKGSGLLTILTSHALTAPPASGVAAKARKELVESVGGKYREQLRPAEAFMHDKAEEKRLEERRWQS